MAEHDPTDLRALDREHEKSSRKAKLDGEVEASDIKWLMAHRQGRRIAYRLLARAGVWQSSFNTNALLMSFNEGRRNDGLALLALVTQQCPTKYLDMLEEHKPNDT
jgi:hypothetical protein